MLLVNGALILGAGLYELFHPPQFRGSAVFVARQYMVGRSVVGRWEFFIATDSRLAALRSKTAASSRPVFL